MEIAIGKKIYLNRDYIKKFEIDPKTSKSFQVIAITDVAVGVKNLRNGRTYTLSTASLANNMEPAPTISMPKGRIVANVEPAPTEPEPPTDPVDPVDPPVQDTFTHIPPAVTGGIKIKATNTITSVSSEDDPFGGLYT